MNATSGASAPTELPSPCESPSDAPTPWTGASIAGADRVRRVADMNEPRGGHVALRLGDTRVLVVGGVPGIAAPWPSDFELYDALANRWTLAGAPEDPNARVGGAVALDDDHVLMLLARADGPSMATFQVSSAKWSIASALPFAACSSQLTRTRSGEILALGGRACSDSSPMRDVARWNPVTHTWTKVPPMNVAKMPRTFELGDTLYAYDGAYVERRSATTGYWQMLPPSFAVGVGAAAPLDDTHVLALSEPHGSSWGSWAIHLTRACVYDVAKNAWESAPTLPMWLASADAVPIAPGRVLFVGGIGGSYNNNSEPPVVSPSYGSETWSGIPSLGARFGQSTTQLADGRIVVAGGQYGCHPSCVGALASTYVIDP